MFGRKAVDTQRLLETAHAELTKAEAALEAVLKAESTAAETPQAYAEWRAARTVASAEVERISTLIARLKDEIETQTRQENDESLRKRFAAAKKKNALISKRYRDEGAKAIDMLLALLRDMAEAEIEDKELRESIPEEWGPLLGADFLARGKAAQTRKDLEQKTVSLWVFARTGELVGNQDEVKDLGNEQGLLGQSWASGTKCIRRRFRSVTFLPAERAQFPEPLFMALRLPGIDRPGSAWDGSRISTASQALAVLKRIPGEQQPERIPETELTPIESENAADAAA